MLRDDSFGREFKSRRLHQFYFMTMTDRQRYILHELRYHLPYTLGSVAAAMALLGLLSALIENSHFQQVGERMFHIFHPLHLLFSATTATAMFWKYEKRLVKTVLLGSLGSVGICGLSDVVFPYLSGTLLGTKMVLHICLIEHWQLVLPFTAIGVFSGVAIDPGFRVTLFSHAGHVFSSSMASLLYLVSFGFTNWMSAIGMVFIYTVLAVIVPCCGHDIVFPLVLTKRPPEPCLHEHQ